MPWLGVDMGGTATRWVLRDNAGVVARGQVAGATALPDPALRAGLIDALRQICTQLPRPPRRAVLGLTGAGLEPDDALVRACAGALGLAPARARVLNDVVLAWHAAYPQGGGHLVAAGTGSVGLSIDTAGAVTLVGGRGALIDDAGSGAWLGLHALKAVWRDIDRHGAPRLTQPLAARLFARIGGDDWDTTRRWIYAGDRGRPALLAPAVAEAARDGDAEALALLEGAGRALARLAQALVARCGPAPVAVTGGVLALHPAISEAMRAALPGVALHAPILDAAAHGAAMARALDHPEVS